MGRTQVFRLKCDICATVAMFDSTDTADWLEFTIDGMIDREWHDKAICPSCRRSIESALRMRPAK